MPRYAFLIAVLLLCGTAFLRATAAPPSSLPPSPTTAAGSAATRLDAGIARGWPWTFAGPRSSTGYPRSVLAGPVDPQVLADLAASRSGFTTFVVTMEEAPGGGPASAVPAQMGLEQALVLLRDRGLVAGYTAFYGANGVVIRGDRLAVQFVAGWPGVARIVPEQQDARWDELMARAAATDAASATGHITGLVASVATGLPLAGIKVTAYQLISFNTWSIAGSATTGPDGSYDIGALATGIFRVKFEDQAGNYVMEYYDDKRDWALANNFDVTDGQTTPGISATLAVAGKIAGVITSAANGAAKSQILAAAWRSQGGTWTSEGNNISGTNGAYIVGGLPAGAYRVRFANPYYPTIPDEPEWYVNVPTRDLGVDIAVVAGATTSGIDAAIGMNGYIDGAVTSYDGATVAGVAVKAYQYNPVLATFQVVSQTVTSAGGAYLFTLLGGTYRVEFSDTVGQLLAEYYDDKATLQSANDIKVDADGSTTSGIDAALAAPVVAGTRPLAAGWNLVSSLLYPVDPAPPAPFNSLGGSYNLVYAYNGCQPAAAWTKYDPAAPPYANNLASVSVRQGWWIRLAGPATLAINGRMPVRTQITLCQGWNLVGYPSSTARPVAAALAGISGKYSLVQSYDATDTADPWKEYDPANPGSADLTTMQPWTGYWIQMTQNATLTVDNR